MDRKVQALKEPNREAEAPVKPMKVTFIVDLDNKQADCLRSTKSVVGSDGATRS